MGIGGANIGRREIPPGEKLRMHRMVKAGTLLHELDDAGVKLSVTLSREIGWDRLQSNVKMSTLAVPFLNRIDEYKSELVELLMARIQQSPIEQAFEKELARLAAQP